jgi:hypothetical protein
VRAADGGLLFEVPARRRDTSMPLPAVTAIAWTATGLEQDGQVGGPTPLALAARQEVAVPAAKASAPAAKVFGPVAEASAPAANASAPAAQGAAPIRREEAGRTGPEMRVRGFLAAGDPRVVALAAVAAALLTLEAWGMLRLASGGAAPVRRREAAGFLALLVTLGLLYALSLEISPEGLAGVELALLAMSLVAWLRRRIERPGLARLLLAAALAACTIVPPWLAGRNRLAADPASLRGASLAVGSGHAADSVSPFSSTTFTAVSNRRSFDA